MSAAVSADIALTNEHRVFIKVRLKYKLMRIRSKIAFMALKSRMTVLELFVRAILNSFEQLMAIGAVPALTDA